MKLVVFCCTEKNVGENVLSHGKQITLLIENQGFFPLSNYD